VLLARDGGQIRCLVDACDHRGGPLHQGTIEDGCVTCPWHASIFRLSDGGVVQGPATAPQPALDVRLNDGNVEVRAPGGA
jgi:nitrite reductase/ring-hydroxylating ferredoxin subunit